MGLIRAVVPISTGEIVKVELSRYIAPGVDVADVRCGIASDQIGIWN